MKKFLLFACAAVFSLAASAQKAVNPNAQCKAVHVNQAQKMSVNQEKMESSDLNASTLQLVKKMGMKKAAAGADKLVGKYVKVAYETYEDAPDDNHFVTSGASIKETTIEADGQTYEVLLLTLAQEYGDVELLCEYDPEDQKLYVPVQYCFEYKNYGKMEMYGVGDDGYLSDDGITFSYDEETGTLTMDQYGWVIYMTEYAEANPDDEYPFWDMSLGSEDALAQVNGFMEFSYTNSKKEKVTEDPDIYVEDLGEEVNIFNFWGTGCVNMIINDDYTVSMPNRQITGPLYLQNEDDYAIYSRFFHAYPLTDNGTVDTDAEYATGVLLNIDFTTGEFSSAKVGEPANGIYFNYLAKASLFDEEGSGYGSIMSGNIIVYPAGFSATLPTAIKNVTDNSAATNATFNLAGQRVSKDFKGVVVKGGKKMLMK